MGAVTVRHRAPVSLATTPTFPVRSTSGAFCSWQCLQGMGKESGGQPALLAEACLQARKNGLSLGLAPTQQLIPVELLAGVA